MTTSGVGKLARSVYIEQGNGVNGYLVLAQALLPVR